MAGKNFYRRLFALRGAAAFLFSSECIFCGAPASGESCLCKECRKDFFKPVEVPVPENSPFSRAVSAGIYSGALKKVLLTHKFGKDYSYAIPDILSLLVFAFDEKYSGEEFDFVVPVPFFEKDGDTESGIRLRELAKLFAKLSGIRFCGDMLVKNRQTEKQHNLPAKERKTNLIGAFSATEKAAGKRILLFDDVFTTGSTALECSRALRDEHAEKVCVLTVLKTAGE